jgi:hypothetical protein
MKKLLIVAFAALAAVTVVAQEAELKKIAVFVQNRTNVPGMDDEVDGIRDRLAAALAEVKGFSVVDSAQVADTFRRYKVTTAEEKAGGYSGIFTGGSIPRVAQMIGCDYIVAASIVNANAMSRNVSGTLAKVFNLRMALKVMDTTGASVFGMPVKPYTFPATDAANEDMSYYQILLDRWATDAETALATAAPKWRKGAASAELVSFTVKTTLDQSIGELESQTKGAKGEDLVQLRKIVGGVSVELDGAVIGSAPLENVQVPRGLHQIRVTREWMKPYEATVNVQEGMVLQVALELSNEGIAKWSTIENLRANLATRYAEAAMVRGIKMNIDTSNVRDISGSSVPTQRIVIEKQ